MAVKKNSILGQLNTKKLSLEKDAKTATAQAEYLSTQISGLKASAQLSFKQKAAVEQALSILTEAGVEV